MTYDAIVIGVGGMGSATLFHLARRRKRVLGLEQFNIPHDLGSSHGVNRIIRLAYAENPDYVPLLRRAYELWRELELQVGERLLFITGGIDAGPEGGEIVQGSLCACKAHHLPHEVLDSKSLRCRFPGYQLPSKMLAVYQPDGGFVLSERCIVSHVVAAQRLGAEVHARERVIEWNSGPKGVEVRTERRRYRADKLVITAGSWAAKMVPGLLKFAIPERQVVIWTQPLRPDYFRLGAFPVFNMETNDKNRFYGFPVYGVPGFKIGKYHHRKQRVLNLRKMDRECRPEDEKVLRKGIRRFFPEADGPTMAMTTCLFTNSPDEDFIIDLHPDFPNVSIAAGFSGHGFKFCSVVGELMADLALNGHTERDIGLFSLKRFST